jgi:hypothetical protein
MPRLVGAPLRPARVRTLQRVEAEATKSAQLRSGVWSVELNQLGKVFEALGLVEE